MSIRMIDHGRAEAAIRVSREYADLLAELARALKAQRNEINSHWQGASFDQFSEDIDSVLRLLSHSEAAGRSASRRMAQGLQRARDDEREAELRALQGL